MKKLLILGCLVITGWYWISGRTVTLGPGVRIETEPQQQNLPEPQQQLSGDYDIFRLASFSIQAKVLGRENYFFGRETDLSPMDLALGWGRMSDESVLDQIEISQSGRFYYWRVKQFPIPRREIETHSANMHMVPANDQVRAALKRVHKGDIIELSGYLVNIRSATDDWRWHSSLTRDDTGNGACELILVENFQIVTDMYR